MASLFRSLAAPLTRLAKPSPARAQCRRTFVASPVLPAGHNKWSKIRHDKAANDAKKSASRTFYTNNITLYSKLYGPDPDHNPQLANAITVAKKASVPKDKIEAAIARAQGRSLKGVALEALTFEAILPPNIALIVDVETDNKLGILTEINKTIRKSRGSVSPSKFYFKRTGRVVFEKSESGLDIDQIMDDAIEAGAEDLENDADGNIVVWTRPTGTMQVCKDLGSKFGLKILTSSILWAPNEDTRARLDASDESDEVMWFTELLWALKARPDVLAVYSNVTRGSMSDAEWANIEGSLDR